MIDIAKTYISHNLCVVPSMAKEKRPIGDWKIYQTRYPNESEIIKHFTDTKRIGFICGQISQNLTCLDFDNKAFSAQQTFDEFCQIDDVLNILSKYKLPIETTPSGGFHMYFKSQNELTSTKLAMVEYNGKKETLIETKGKGGFVICYPSPEYNLISGNLLEIPTLDENETDILLTACKCFDRIPIFAKETKIEKQTDITGKRPGEIFNESINAHDIVTQCLLDYGWTKSYTTAKSEGWVRPNKKKGQGISATLGFHGAGVLHVFSSSAHPFEANRAYKPFQILALLKYNGDFSQAAKSLVNDGYKDTSVNKVKDFARSALHAGRKLTEVDFDMMAKTHELPKDKVKKIMVDVIEKDSNELGFDSKDPIEKSKIFINKKYKIARNIVTDKIEYYVKGNNEVGNLNINNIYLELKSKLGIKISFDDLRRILESDFIPSYDPFVQYFKSLHNKWDGNDYLTLFASMVKTDNDVFFRNMFIKHMIRCVRQALEGEVNRYAFILASEKQNIGKSRWTQFLNPFGKKYWYEGSLRDNKDMEIALAENFIINLEELDNLDKIGISKVKSLVSRLTVKERRAFRMDSEEMPRRCNFFGSTNNCNFLGENTNTRFLIFTVNSIDFAYYDTKKGKALIDINQLWAQAYAMYYDSFDCDLTDQEKQLQANINENHVAESEEDLILDFVSKPKNDNGIWQTTTQFKILIEERHKNLRLDIRKLGKILSYNKFKNKMIKGRKFWYVTALN